MTTTAAQPPPARVPTPRPKASRTSSLVSESAPATKSRPSQQPHAPDEGAAKSQQPGLPRRGGRPASADPLSDKATAFLVRRILCPQQADKGKGSPDSIEGLLPPLTSRNDVDLQLYALIAIILREFVQSWYAKITADETFVAEIVHIIAHITRALEQRVRTVDLESLLFDELPDLLDKHVTAYRIAHDPMAQAPVATDPREVYHSLCPLPALSPVPRPEDSNSVAAQAENEAAYRQLLVDAFLAVLLPTEDLQNGCLTALVGQILSELILGNAVADRLSQPWLIWELLIIAARVVGAGAGKGAEQQERSRRRSNTSSDVRTRLRHSVHALFYTCLQWCFFAVTFIRTVFTILMTSGSLPSRVSHGESAKGAAQRGTTHEAADPASPADLHSPRTPVLAFRCWSALSNLAEVDIRMPWLRGAISLLQWIAVMRPGRVAGFDSALDRFLSYSIQRHILTAANLPPLLRAVRGALFPNNMPAGNPTLVPPSSNVELRALRRRCASALWALVPKGVGRLYFGGGLLRANPVLTMSRVKTEGSADSKTAAVGKLDNNGKDTDRGKGRPSFSLSSKEDVAKEKASAVETVPIQTTQAREQERPRSGSQPRSRRSAPVPRPKTGGQGSAAASADPPRPSPPLPPSKTSSASEEARTGMAPQDDEKMSRQDRDHDHDDVHNDDDDDDEDDNNINDDDDEEEILTEIEQCILDVFSDAYCNKHLVYGVLELILVRLLPELTEKVTLELWKERISV